MKQDDMRRRDTHLPDGRYLLYYSFDAEAPKESPPPPPPPDEEPRV
jgi:hypothetical protein